MRPNIDLNRWAPPGVVLGGPSPVSESCFCARVSVEGQVGHGMIDQDGNAIPQNIHRSTNKKPAGFITRHCRFSWTSRDPRGVSSASL